MANIMLIVYNSPFSMDEVICMMGCVFLHCIFNLKILGEPH